MKKRRTNEFWVRYEDIALMVVGYDQACDFCAWFIINRCQPRTTTTESGTDRVARVEILLSRYESVENYEACAKLFQHKNGFDIPDIVCIIRIKDYIFNALAVLYYNVNIEECSEVFCEYG